MSLDNPKGVAGPYWLVHGAGGGISVRGRYGKIIARYPAALEAAAEKHRMRLQATYIPPAPKPVRLTIHQQDVLHRAREGIQYRNSVLAGVFADCWSFGWINADPTEYGLHVTLTPAGMQVAP